MAINCSSGFEIKFDGADPFHPIFLTEEPVKIAYVNVSVLDPQTLKEVDETWSIVNSGPGIHRTKIHYGKTFEEFDVMQEARELQPEKIYQVFMGTSHGTGNGYFKIVKEGEGYRLVAIPLDEIWDRISEERKKSP